MHVIHAPLRAYLQLACVWPAVWVATRGTHFTSSTLRGMLWPVGVCSHVPSLLQAFPLRLWER